MLRYDTQRYSEADMREKADKLCPQRRTAELVERESGRRPGMALLKFRCVLPE